MPLSSPLGFLSAHVFSSSAAAVIEKRSQVFHFVDEFAAADKFPVPLEL